MAYHLEHLLDTSRFIQLLLLILKELYFFLSLLKLQASLCQPLDVTHLLKKIVLYPINLSL
jgi:hypothetical protein